MNYWLMIQKPAISHDIIKVLRNCLLFRSRKEIRYDLGRWMYNDLISYEIESFDSNWIMQYAQCFWHEYTVLNNQQIYSLDKSGGEGSESSGVGTAGSDFVVATTNGSSNNGAGNVGSNSNGGGSMATFDSGTTVVCLEPYCPPPSMSGHLVLQRGEVIEGNWVI